MAKINKLCVGESLVGERATKLLNIDLIIGPRGSAGRNGVCDWPLPTIRMVSPRCGGGGSQPARQARDHSVQQGDDQECDPGRADVRAGQHGVAKAVRDSVAAGVIPVGEPTIFHLRR